MPETEAQDKRCVRVFRRVVCARSILKVGHRICKELAGRHGQFVNRRSQRPVLRIQVRQRCSARCQCYWRVCSATLNRGTGACGHRYMSPIRLRNPSAISRSNACIQWLLSRDQRLCACGTVTTMPGCSRNSRRILVSRRAVDMLSPVSAHRCSRSQADIARSAREQNCIQCNGVQPRRGDFLAISQPRWIHRSDYSLSISTPVITP